VTAPQLRCAPPAPGTTSPGPPRGPTTCEPDTDRRPAGLHGGADGVAATVVGVSAATRERLPLRVVIASTVIALAAAVAVYQLLDGDSGPGAATEVGLVPLDEQAHAQARTADELADVTFQDIGGTTSTLGDLRGTPVVVNFFASWCAPCRTEMPAFERVHQALGQEVTFLGLAVRDRPEDVHATVADTGVTYRIGRDVDDRVLTAVGALGPLPSTALLDARGNVVEVRRGELDERQLRALLSEHFGTDA
jgi:cytochrome c biogenesis protein CcmG, thiol:disulfide interchange protein DsbE